METSTLDHHTESAAPPAKPHVSAGDRTIEILGIIAKFLIPAGELATLWIHNPNSQHKLAVVVGDVNAITAVSSTVLGNQSAQ